MINEEKENRGAERALVFDDEIFIGKFNFYLSPIVWANQSPSKLSIFGQRCGLNGFLAGTTSEFQLATEDKSFSISFKNWNQPKPQQTIS